MKRTSNDTSTESQYHERSVHDLPPTDTPLSPDERPDQQSPETQRERRRTMTRVREAESARLPATPMARRRMPPEVNQSRRKAVDIQAALLLLQLPPGSPEAAAKVPALITLVLVNRTPATPAPSPLSVRHVVGGERWTPDQHHGTVTLEGCVRRSA